nr:LpqB family beta-propeller domain-containing protein [Microbacterium excoecariae]
MRGVSVAAVLGTAILLAGCAGLPTTGYVQPGEEVGSTSSDVRWQFTPEGPAEGASPEEIVLGFLDASESPAGDWAIAREFLTADAAAEWEPEARVTVDSVNEREVSDFVASDASDDAGEVTARVTPTAVVSDGGQYAPSEGIVRRLSYELALVDGQWRISEAPDGVVVQSGSFESIFTAQAVFYSAPGGRLVPDVRWLADTGQQTQRLTELLVEGAPSSWLAPAVTTAFSDVTVAGTVTIEGGVAAVALSEEALEAADAVRARMRSQLENTLAGVGATEVRMTVGGEELSAPLDNVVDVRPDARAIALTEDDFGYLSGGEITPIEGLTEAMTARFTPDSAEGDPATAITVSADLGQAIVQTASEQLWRVRADGTFEALSYEGGWVRPSLDPFGYAWAAQASGTAPLRVWGGGEGRALEEVADFSEIVAVEVSRDGARVAIAGVQDDRSVLLVAGIERDEDGAPVGLTDPIEIGAYTEPIDGVAWVADAVVAATIPSDGRTIIREQIVGGTSTSITAPYVVTAMTYGNPQSRERILTSDGSLYVRATTGWGQAGQGVVVLATQMGAPPAL